MGREGGREIKRGGEGRGRERERTVHLRRKRP